jgi:hypothetical protein
MLSDWEPNHQWIKGPITFPPGPQISLSRFGIEVGREEAGEITLMCVLKDQPLRLPVSHSDLEGPKAKRQRHVVPTKWTLPKGLKSKCFTFLLPGIFDISWHHFVIPTYWRLWKTLTINSVGNDPKSGSTNCKSSKSFCTSRKRNSESEWVKNH